MPVLKKWKSLGFFCCSVWLSLLPAEEELSQVMPLPKWFTWVHRPTVPHVIHTVIDLFLYKNLWLSQYKLLLRCTYFCCNVDITALKKKKKKNLLLLSVILLLSWFFFTSIIRYQRGVKWWWEETFQPLMLLLQIRAFYDRPKYKRADFAIHGSSV